MLSPPSPLRKAGPAWYPPLPCSWTGNTEHLPSFPEVTLLRDSSQHTHHLSPTAHRVATPEHGLGRTEVPNPHQLGLHSQHCPTAELLEGQSEPKGDRAGNPGTQPGSRKPSSLHTTAYQACCQATLTRCPTTGRKRDTFQDYLSTNTHVHMCALVYVRVHTQPFHHQYTQVERTTPQGHSMHRRGEGEGEWDGGRERGEPP